MKIEQLKREGREEFHQQYPHGLYHMGIQNGDDGYGGVRGHGYPKNESIAVFLDSFAEKIWLAAIESAIAALPAQDEAKEYVYAYDHEGNAITEAQPTAEAEMHNEYRREALASLVALKKV